MSPLSSVAVLEIGEAHAAGYAGKLFQRWGASVIRVDLPDASSLHTRAEHVAVDLYLHAGKRRVAVDYSSTAGRDLLDRLAAKSDILVADLPASELDRLRWRTLGGSALKVRAAVTPFGLDGAYRDWAGTSNVLLAMGGQTILMGDPDRAPLTMPGRYLHDQAGQYAYVAALASHRAWAGETQTLDVSVLETALSLSQFTTVMWTFGRQIRARHGNNFSSLHPITLYPCADGWFAVNVTPNFWDPFTVMLGRPELAEDERFASIDARMQNSGALDAIVHAELGCKTRAEILELGQRACRVPTGILATPEELMADPHLAERGFWQTLRYKDRTLKTAGSPFRYVGKSQPPQADPCTEEPVDALLRDAVR